MPKRKTHEEFVEEISDRPITVLGEYENVKTKIEFKCDWCNNRWQAEPSGILYQEYSCPRCNGEEAHREYIEELDHVSPKERFINYTTSLLHICQDCGTEFINKPHLVRDSKHECPTCRKRALSKKYQKPHKQYLNEVQGVAGDIVPVEEYSGHHAPIKHRCQKCGYVWKAKPDTVLTNPQSDSCPKCGDGRGNGHSYSHEQYLDMLSDRPIKPLEKYQGISTPIKHKCLDCGYEWVARPSVIKDYGGCTRCRQSHGENEIEDILRSKSIQYVRDIGIDGCIDSDYLRFDFCLVDGVNEYKRVLSPSNVEQIIEFDGKQHFKPVAVMGGEEKYESRTKHDRIKNDFCASNDIPLLRVNYKDRENGDLEEKVLDFLD